MIVNNDGLIDQVKVVTLRGYIIVYQEGGSHTCRSKGRGLRSKRGYILLSNTNEEGRSSPVGLRARDRSLYITPRERERAGRHLTGHLTGHLPGHLTGC